MVKVLEVRNLNYKKMVNINLTFESGKIYFIAGGNNSGKTTLFELMSGIIKTSNTICCDNVWCNEIKRKEFIRKIGVVRRVNKQSFIYKTVIDEMIYPLYNLNNSKKSIFDRINNVLSFFDMNYIKNKNIGDLSLYEKQMLLIMISILHRPKVLLLDNAINYFSQKERDNLFNKLKLLVEDDLCIINFTSTLIDALYCDNIVILKDFNVVCEVKRDEMFSNDKLFYENDLEIPFICDLNNKLKMYQMVDKNYLNMKDLVDSIWQ